VAHLWRLMGPLMLYWFCPGLSMRAFRFYCLSVSVYLSLCVCLPLSCSVCLCLSVYLSLSSSFDGLCLPLPAPHPGTIRRVCLHPNELIQLDEVFFWLEVETEFLLCVICRFRVCSSSVHSSTSRQFAFHLQLSTEGSSDRPQYY